MAWVLWHLAEIEADFLALYGKEVQVMTEPRDTAGISGPRFLNYCQHLPLYRGAVQNAAIRMGEEEQEHEADPVASLMLNPDLEVTRG